MNIAELVFKAVDGICYPTQNANNYPDVVSVRDIPYGSEKMQNGDLYYVSCQIVPFFSDKIIRNKN